MKKGKPALSTKSGKVQFSAELFRLDGKIGVPTWIAPQVMPDSSKEDEFRLIHGKQPWHSHAMTINNEFLMAMTERYEGTRMWINTARAKKLGIKNGDKVVVESSIAKKEVTVKVTELIHPECVWIPSTYGGYSPMNKTAYNVGVNFNDFIPVMVEPWSGSAMQQEVVVKIRKGAI